MIRLMKGLLVAGVFAGMSVMGGSRTAADIIPTLASIEPEGANFRWTYEAAVTVGQRVEQNDFFTIYDFLGFVPDSNQQPPGWAFLAQLTGVTPALTNPVDRPDVMNLTWSWTGEDPIGDGTGAVDLGPFSAVSTFGQFDPDQLGFFAGRGTKTTEPEEGTKLHNLGQVAVPIPLPAAVLMFPAGLVMAGLLYRRMVRRS